MKWWASVTALVLLAAGEDLRTCETWKNDRTNGLEICEPIIEGNALAMCMKDGERREGRGGGKASSTRLGRFLLRLNYWVSPVKSWSQQAVKDGTFDKEYSEGAYKNWQDHLKYVVVGDISIVLGVLLVLVLLCFLLPILWCRCARNVFVNKAHTRIRTNRLTVIVLASILAVLGVIFLYGAIWYSVWSLKDVDGARCTATINPYQIFYGSDETYEPFKPGAPMDNKASEELNSGKPENFQGLREWQYDLMALENSLTSYAPALQNSTYGSWTGRALNEMLAPFLFTPKFVTSRVYSGWAQSGIMKSSTSFPLGLTTVYDHRAITWTSPNDVAQKYLSSYGQVSQMMDAVPALQVPAFGSNSGIITGVNETAAGLNNAQEELGNVSEEILQIYDDAMDKLNEAYVHQNVGDYVSIVMITLSCLPFIGLVLGLVLLYLYLQSDSQKGALQGPQIKTRRLAGFLSFGFLFYSAALFILGGAILIPGYFVADLCETYGEKALEQGRFEEYGLLTYSATLAKECLTKDGSGQLLGSSFDFEEFKKAAELQGLTEEVHPLIDALLASIGTQPIPDHQALLDSIENADWEALSMIAIDPSRSSYPLPSTSDPRLRVNILSEESIMCDKSPAVQEVCNTLGRELNGGTVPLKLYGLQELADGINEFINAACQKDLFKVCVGSCALGGEVRLDRDTVWNLDASRYTDDQAAAYRPPSDRLADIADCVVEAGEGSTFYAAIWHGARMTEATRTLKRDPRGALPETERVSSISVLPGAYSDFCSPNTECNIFTRLKDRTDLNAGFEYVTLEEWKASIKDDLLAAVTAFDDTTKTLEYVKARVVQQTTLSSLYDFGLQLEEMNDCRAFRDFAMQVKYLACDNLAADFVATGWFWFLLGLIHFFAFIMCLLFWVARRRRHDVEGSQVNAYDTRLTVLDFLNAAEHGDLETVKKCTKQFEPSQVLDPAYRNSPLHLAAYYGHGDIVKHLLDAGWNPNELNFHHYTPTSACVTNHNLPKEEKAHIIKSLVGAGGDLETYDSYGNTCLMIAARANETDLVDLLLDLGANPDTTDDYNCDAVEISQKIGNSQLMNLLSASSPRRQGDTRASLAAMPQSPRQEQGTDLEGGERKPSVANTPSATPADLSFETPPQAEPKAEPKAGSMSSNDSLMERK